MSVRGFTLIELMVVIAIIAILAVVGVTIFSSVQNSARISAAKETLANLRQAMIRYKINNGELPPTGDSCPGCQPDNTLRAADMRNQPLAALIASGNGGPYIMNVEDFVYDPWGQAYYYDDNDANITPDYPCQSTSNPPAYVSYIYSLGPDKASGGGDDIFFYITCP